MDLPPPPPPPPRPPLQLLPSAVPVDPQPPAEPSPSISLSPSLFIIAGIIAAVVVTSLSIHLLLRFLSCRRRSSSAVSALPLPLVNPRSASGGSSSFAGADSALSDGENVGLVDSLPVFTMASTLASLPKSSPECAVCLCPFRPHDVLRLLPACCHAFHSSCVDPWLRNTPSCPLCRTSISLPAAPLQLLPWSAAPPSSGDRDASRSGSFRIEIGSISRRRASLGEEPGNPPPAASAPPQQHLRAYSIGSSFEYLVEEEVEAVVARITRRMEKVEKQGDVAAVAETEPAAPGEGVAEAAGEGGGGRGWLREYVDRLASSASSSFSSLRFSGRWSHRYEGDGGVPEGQNAWELQGSARREAEEGGYYGFYRWLIGA